VTSKTEIEAFNFLKFKIPGHKPSYCLEHEKCSHQIINGFHFGSLERDLANFGTRSSCRTIDLNLDDFSFDDLSLFADSDADALSVGSEQV
jgi:hypothetical protein